VRKDLLVKIEDKEGSEMQKKMGEMRDD